MHQTTNQPSAGFFPDRTGTEYLVLDKTAVKSWSELYELLDAIHTAGFKAISRHYSAAAEVTFAREWNRLARQYTSKRSPIHGHRMRTLVARVVAALEQEPSP